MSRSSLPAESSLRLIVLGELASGGMGRVDLARVVTDDSPQAQGQRRILAVKRLHPHLARDARFVEMFLDEVWMTAALRHPNVVELVGWGRDAAGVFLAMEFVHGAALSVIERAGRDADDPLPAELIAFIGARIAEGLGAAHALVTPQGVPLQMIHRDVTPSNILIGFDGSVKITDFGVAKAAGRSTNTATGVLKGKVSYMSPEYARAQGFDHRSDLYSMGVALFELATGLRPFVAEHDLELLRLIMEEPAPPIEVFEPTFDHDLGAIIHGLLLKEPGERPSSGEVVQRALDGWLAARGFERAGLERSLAAYADRHAADRKAEVAALLGTPDLTWDHESAPAAEGTATDADALHPRPSPDSVAGPSDPAAPGTSSSEISPRPKLPAIPRPPRPQAPPRPTMKHEESQLLTVLRSPPPAIEPPLNRPRPSEPLPSLHEDAEATTALPALASQDEDAATLFPPMRLVQDPATESLPSVPTAMLDLARRAPSEGWQQERESAGSRQPPRAAPNSAVAALLSLPVARLPSASESGLMPTTKLGAGPQTWGPGDGFIPEWASPRAARAPGPNPFTKAPSDRDLMGVGLVTFFLVAIAMALLLPWSNRAPSTPSQAEAARTSAPSSAASASPAPAGSASTTTTPEQSAAAIEAPSGAPTEAPTTIASGTTSTSAAPPQSSKPKAPAPPSSSARPKSSGAPSTRPPSSSTAPKRSCRPADPDYPRCLLKPR